MKILNFTAVDVLPALLDKTKLQTIRPAWKKENCDILVGNFPPHGNLYEVKDKLIEKPSRFKVADKVRILWNQRSKHKHFCRECGEGIDGYITEYGNTKVFRIDRLHECTKERHVEDFLDLVFYDNSVFNKHLGNAEITEVFKIKLSKNVLEIDWLSYQPLVNIEVISKREEYKIENIVKLDGFKSPEDMFNYFDKHYDIAEGKAFWVYRFRWL